jgi:hypothetical protein
MPANFVLLERTELNASAASVTFANIPQTGYTDLKVVLSTRTTDTTANDSTAIALQFNGDTASNYSRRSLVGDGASATSTNATTTSMRIGFTTTNGCTANTFGNGEFYVPNYTGSTQKSVSADAVAENNSTTFIYSALNAGLWTGTAAITSITVLTPSFSFLANSTFSLYGLAALGTTPVIAPKASGGNVIATDGTYWYHAFNSSGTFTPQTGLTCDALVIAGGGGGGNFAQSGGGGAGGLVGLTNQLLTTTSYAVTIGAGGATGGGSFNTQASDGTNSSIAGFTAAVGGGGAGTYDGRGGRNGGSGGGEGGRGGNASGGGSGTAGQGFAGGNGTTSNNEGGGGGGAGAAGNTGGQAKGGNGLSTYSSWGAATNTGQNISGTRWYAGGGGGYGAGTSGGNGGGGGLGTPGVLPGTANTGGGGGAWYDNGGAGGSGIIIIRYLMA